jgi:predicted O-methyltransferase YrrM
MPSFTKKLTWYLRRPVLYPVLVRDAVQKARRVLFNSDDLAESRSRAEAWCIQRAISTREALIKITEKAPSETLNSQFADIFKQSEETVAACPIKMGGPGDLDLLYHLAEHISANKVIETGVAYGWSSLALLLSLKKRNGILVSTDLSYPGMDNEPYVGCVVPEELRDKWKLLRGADRQRIPEAIRFVGTIDLCHYDSDKSYAGRMWTYPRLWEALRTGGIFISDDIGDNMGFACFAHSVAVEPVIVHTSGKYVGILVRP